MGLTVISVVGADGYEGIRTMGIFDNVQSARKLMKQEKYNYYEIFLLWYEVNSYDGVIKSECWREGICVSG